jgi:hypothetical protein
MMKKPIAQPAARPEPASPHRPSGLDGATDATTQTTVSTVGMAPGMAEAQTYLSSSHSLQILLANATQRQNDAFIQGQAATLKTVVRTLQHDPIADALALARTLVPKYGGKTAAMQVRRPSRLAPLLHNRPNCKK